MAHRTFTITVSKKYNESGVHLDMKTIHPIDLEGDEILNNDIFALIHGSSAILTKALKAARDNGYDCMKLLRLFNDAIEGELLDEVKLDSIVPGHENGSD